MQMPYPDTDRIPVTIYITNGIDRNGVPKVVDTVETKCTLSEKNLYIRDADGRLLKLESRLYIQGDISPSIFELEGKVELFGKEYNIYKAARPRNPDGTVHHTKLELI